MGGTLNIPSGDELGQAWGQDPNSRKRLLAMVMGSDPSATMDAPRTDRIADDLTRHPNADAGSTDDLEARASGAPQRLAEQMRAQTQAPPSRIDQMQAQYDAMQPPRQQPLSKGKRLAALIAGALGGPQAVQPFAARRQQTQDFEEGRYDRNRQTLLSQIEAERRTQEQNSREDERDTTAYARELERQRDTDFRTPPHTLDTAQGPMQFDPATRSWSPISVNGQPVGPKGQAKPDTPEQQFLDSPEESGKSLTQRLQDYARASQRPEQPQRDPQQLAIGPDGTVLNLKPGMTVPQGTQSAAGFEKGATGQQAGRDAMQYANDYMSSGKFTGPGDEALMEKYFELAKPSSGFRMTQAQIEMLTRARDLMGGLTAKAKHYFTPEAPYFSDEQRKQIVATMSMVEGARGGAGQQAPDSAPKGNLKSQVSNQAPEGTRIQVGNQIQVKRNGKWVPEQQ